MDCENCSWRHPDTCRECRTGEVNEQGLTVLERRTLRRLSSLLTSLDGRQDLLTGKEQRELKVILGKVIAVQGGC